MRACLATFFPQSIPSAQPSPPTCEAISSERLPYTADNPDVLHYRRAVCLVLGAAALLAAFTTKAARAQDCSVSARDETAVSRRIQLDLNCPNAPFFKLSESPDYGETAETGVTVTIDNIDPLGEYADISVFYPNGTAGENATLFAVTETVREVRILAVLFTTGDGALPPPSYATPAWVDKLVFGSDHDGRGLANSIKAHIEQNTYGTVLVSGEVYPTWVEVSPLEVYRDLSLSPASDRKFAEDIVQRLVETDPGFFTGKDFDFLIALTPGGLKATALQPYSFYTQWPDMHGIFEGYAMYDIPIVSNSPLYDTIYNELRTSATNTMVIPLYNPRSVEGVWLASDTAHEGINYLTGGSVRYDTANPNLFAHFISSSEHHCRRRIRKSSLPTNHVFIVLLPMSK
jgi:hypothetical protein